MLSPELKRKKEKSEEMYKELYIGNCLAAEENNIENLITEIVFSPLNGIFQFLIFWCILII